MKSQTLFEITRDHLTILQLIEENDGLLDAESEKALQLNRESLHSKALAYVQLIRFCESEIDRAKEAESQIQAFKKRKQAVIDRLKVSLEDAVNVFGPIETGFLKLSLRKSESVVIEDPEVIPPSYLIEKVSRVPNKTKIKTELRNGEEVPGASLLVRRSLQIR